MAEICYDTDLVGACAPAPSTFGRRLEDEAARGFDALRQFACIIWWDGSAIGLRLNGFIGLFGGIETDSMIEAPEDLA